MDASCKIQESIHVLLCLIHKSMCPGFWVHIKQMIERQPLTFSGEDTESKRFVMIKTFESERGKEYTGSRGLKKNNGERGFRQMYCCLKKCK